MPNDEEYSGAYAMGEPYARVIPNPQGTGLTCPKCSKELKSKSGYLLHVKKCCPDTIGDSPYQTRSLHQPKGVWQFELNEFDADLKNIDPRMYFITSGEATIKASKLCEDLEKALNASRKLLMVLKSLKGKAKYLETQWETGRLLLKQKNPRPTSRLYQKMKAKVIDDNSNTNTDTDFEFEY